MMNGSQKPGSGELADAINRNDAKAVRDLLDRGADFNEQDEAGRSMLSLAVAPGHIDIVRLLAGAGADVNKAGKSQIMPLMSATSHGHIEIVRLLLSRGADVDAKTPHGWTAVIYAVNKKRPDILRLLVEWGADISTKDTRSGMNALDIAERWNQTEMIRILKDAPEIRRRVQEQDPFHTGHDKIARKQELLKARAKRCQIRVQP